MPETLKYDDTGTLISGDINQWYRENDSLPADAVQANPPLNRLTGTIGKTFDTFLDALAINGANKLIGSVYPTGQQSPGALAAQKQAISNESAVVFDPKKYLGIGLMIAGILVLGAVAVRIARR